MTTGSLGCFLFGKLLDQAFGRITQLRALALPVGKTIIVHAERFLSLRCFGIIETDALNETPIACALRIGDHQIKKRTLLRAAACQPDYDHDVLSRNCERA